jgi:Protein of unknown function (DUF2924)
MRKTLRSGPIGTAPPPPLESAANPIGVEVPSTARDLEAEFAKLERLSSDDLRLRWRNHWGRLAPAHLSRALLLRVMAYRLQTQSFGDLDRKTIRMLERLADDAAHKSAGNGPATFRSDGHVGSKVSCARAAYEPLDLKPGALLIREWQGRLERVTVVDEGFAWNGATYASLSAAAFAITGTKWNGRRFFGVQRRDRIRASKRDDDPSRKKSSCSVRGKPDRPLLEARGSSSSLAGVISDGVERNP